LEVLQTNEHYDCAVLARDHEYVLVMAKAIQRVTWRPLRAIIAPTVQKMLGRAEVEEIIVEQGILEPWGVQCQGISACAKPVPSASRPRKWSKQMLPVEAKP